MKVSGAKLEYLLLRAATEYDFHVYSVDEYNTVYTATEEKNIYYRTIIQLRRFLYKADIIVYRECDTDWFMLYSYAGTEKIHDYVSSVVKALTHCACKHNS